MQPPSGGCVLKHCRLIAVYLPILQPPSGGCVLKQVSARLLEQNAYAAAFGRLCVETFTI